MINGDVVRGVSVIFSADVFGQIVKGIRRQMIVALEHHVLKEMSKTAAAIWIVLRTDVIPDLHCDGRALVIFDGVNLKSVRQRCVFEGQWRNGYRPARGGAFRGGERWRESKTKNETGQDRFHKSVSTIHEISDLRFAICDLSNGAAAREEPKSKIGDRNREFGGAVAATGL